MNFYFNCYVCNKRFNFQENYCENCLNRVSNDQNDVFKLIESVIIKKRENSIMRKRIETSILSDEIVKIENIKKSKESLLNSKREQIQALRDRIQELKQLNDIESENIDKRMKYLSRRRTTLKSNKTMFNNDDKTGHDQQLLMDIDKEKQKVQELQSMIENKKKSMVEVLTNKILKFKPSNTPDHYYIINIVFNDFNFSKYPKDIVFITIGYISRITNLIANYLGIMVPNEVIYRGSASYIQRSPTRIYPLYFNKSSQNRDFQKALHLLGENIAFLRYFYGIFTPRESITHFLTNLSELIKSPNLGKDKFIDFDKKYSNFINLDDNNDEDWEMISNDSNSAGDLVNSINPNNNSNETSQPVNIMTNSTTSSMIVQTSSYSPRRNSLLSMLSSNSLFKKSTPPNIPQPLISNTTTSITSNPSTTSSTTSSLNEENIDQFVTDL